MERICSGTNSAKGRWHFCIQSVRERRNWGKSLVHCHGTPQSHIPSLLFVDCFAGRNLTIIYRVNAKNCNYNESLTGKSLQENQCTTPKVDGECYDLLSVFFAFDGNSFQQFTNRFKDENGQWSVREWNGWLMMFQWASPFQAVSFRLVFNKAALSPTS